jgi:threo-3-hydroxy-L-aspartate ammonia-lyase
LSGAGRPVGLAEVTAAATVLADVTSTTPLVRSDVLDDRLGAEVVCKAESLQRTGSFKLRGAYHALHRLGAEARQRGVVAFSSGNFAQAVACAAHLLGTSATVVMPHDAPDAKVAATRFFGAEIVGYDRYTEDRDAIAAALARDRDVPLVVPFDDPDVIAGQGTVALELLEQAGELDLLVVPVGGGGLAAGCVAAVSELAPDVEVVGVEPAGRPAARRALQQREVVRLEVPTTLLDGQQTTHLGAHPLRVLLDRITVVGVEDAAVVAALRAAMEQLHLVLEPSGASALAAVLDGTVPVAGRRVGIVLSGGNVDVDRLVQLL